MAGRWKNIINGKRVSLAKKQEKIRTKHQQRRAGLRRANGRS